MEKAHKPNNVETDQGIPPVFESLARDAQPTPNADEQYQRIRKSAAKGHVDALVGHHLGLALSARATEQQLLEIEEQARKTCIEAGFSDQEIADTMRRFEVNKSGERVLSSDSLDSYKTNSEAERVTERIEPEIMFADASKNKEVEKASPENGDQKSAEPKAPKLGLGARLRVWASSALLGRSKEVGQKAEEAKILQRQEQERAREQQEQERARSKPASSWLLRAWNKSIYDMSPERTEEIARAKREEQLQKMSGTSARTGSGGGLLGKVARTALLGGVIASLPSEKLADPKMKALEAFSNPMAPTREYAMTKAPSINTPKSVEQKVKKAAAAPVVSVGSPSASATELAPSTEKKISKRADSSNKETSVKKPRIAKRLNYHPGKEPFATEAPLIVSLEDLYAHDIESTVQIDGVKQPRYEKFVAPVSRFEGVEQGPVAFRWSKPDDGFEVETTFKPSQTELKALLRGEDVFWPDPNIKKFNGFTIPENLFTQMDAKALEIVKNDSALFYLYAALLARTESIGAYQTAYMGTGQEYTFKDGMMILNPAGFIHGADYSLSVEQQMERGAKRVTPSGKFAVHLATPEYLAQFGIELATNGHSGFQPYIFTLGGTTYKHGFIAKDVEGQMKASESLNPNAHCMSNTCIRMPEAQLKAIYDYVLPKQPNQNGDRYYYQYILRKGEVLDPETGKVDEKLSHDPKALHDATQKIFDTYRQTHKLRYYLTYDTDVVSGQRKANTHADRETPRKRVINRGVPVVIAPDGPIGG